MRRSRGRDARARSDRRKAEEPVAERREAADDLGLEPGVLAVASVKSTNVVIELPEPS